MSDSTGRPPAVVWAFVAVQVAIPLFGLVARWLGGAEYWRFGWQMFSFLP